VTIKGIGEFGLLERIKPYLAAGAGEDDAAVMHDGHDFLVASVDMFVEGVHFDLSWMSAEDAGWRSVALALGDLAAKGARPGWALVSLAIPHTWRVEAVTGLYAGMAALASRFGLELAGGDMSSTSGPAVLSITVAGRAETRPLARAEARPGWTVGVTGPLGAAAVALRERRAFRLVPLIEEGIRLNGLGLACGDISDGLVREMEKFSAMSGAGSILEAAAVPRAPDASVEEALTGGEEAQLVCVGPDEVVRGAGLQVVGRTTEEADVIVIGSELETTGYDHFA
jgi:thiamine-monophosphate kinase